MIEQKNIKKRLKRLELSNKPTVIITEKLQRQIDYLHSKVKSNEWSGELITREEGTITDLDNWKIIADDIYLANVGTPGYTEYEVDKGGFKAVDVVNMYDRFEDLLEGKLKNQHIHTHHNMNAFFSGTDWENLEDRADVSNYVLMLIVNFSGKYCAKVAFKAKNKSANKSTLTFSNNMDGFKPLSLEEEEDEEILVVMDCNIEHQTTPAYVDSWFSDRFEEVLESQKKEKEEEEKKKKSFSTGRGAKVKGTQKALPFPSSNYKREVSDWEDWDTPFPKESEKYRDKKISEMTEKEWIEHNKKQKKSTGNWENRHVFSLLNSVLTNSFDVDISSPIPKISTIESKFRDSKDREEFLITVAFTMRDKYDALFYPRLDDEEYVELMSKTIDFLDGYKYNKLAEEIMEVCWEEIERFEQRTEMFDESKFNKNDII